jgi:hypothetical protein
MIIIDGDCYSNTGEITLFWEINSLFQSEISANRITCPIHVQLREIGSCFLKTRGSRGEIFSGFQQIRKFKNMTELSNKKRERHVAQILTTKSHAKYVDEPG